MPKQAVILSGSLGMGHDVVSEVVTESLTGLGWESRTLDCMGLLGRRAGRAGDWVFRRLTAMPGVYDGLHFGHLRPGTRPAGAMAGAPTSRLVPALDAELKRRPDDLFIAVFATGASAAASSAGELPGFARPFCAPTPCRIACGCGTGLTCSSSPRLRPPRPCAATSPTPGRASSRRRYARPSTARCHRRPPAGRLGFPQTRRARC